MFKIFTPDNIKTRYIINIQSKNGKAGLYWKDEPENPFDSEAVAIYTKKANGEEVKLGYIQKKIFLSKDADENNVYEHIMDDFKMKVLKNQIDKGVMRFYWDFYEETGWLFKKGERYE